MKCSMLFRLNVILSVGLLFLMSCSGYHFKNKNNPFVVYEIETISIPMFVNWSIVPNVSGPMTSNFINMLMDYSGLTIYSHEKTSADAILVGIISSNDKTRQVYKNKSYQATVGTLNKSIRDRRDFYIPQETEISLTLRVLLIKNPLPHEYNGIVKNDADFIPDKSRVIFDERMELRSTITRSILPSSGAQSGGDVNFTKSKKAQNDAVLALVSTATEKFKNEIIDAF